MLTLSIITGPRHFYGWLRRRYGEVVTLTPLTPGGMPFVLALTSEGARQVLTENPDTYGAFNKRAFMGITGSGSLWVMDGLRHREERQLLAPQFNAQRSRKFGQVIRETTLVNTNTWRVGETVCAYDAMLDISRDVILQVMFGAASGGTIDEGKKVLKAMMQAIHPLPTIDPFFQALWFPPWRRYLRAKKQFSRFVARMLAEYRAGDNELRGVVAHMVAADSPHGTCVRDQEICDELMTVLLSGHETTAVALSWALYELARHPAVLARLRRELDPLGPDPDPDLLASQPYLRVVCDETLRLHTILTEIGRVTRAPCQLLGHALPEGIGLGVGIGAVHQDASLYPEPDEFRPERFIERRYTAFEFLPFGGGHRRCIGAHLSDYEMSIALGTIATRWEFEIAREDYDIRHNIGTGPRYGVRLRVNGRRSIPSRPLR